MEDGGRPEARTGVGETGGRIVLGRLADATTAPGSGETFTTLFSGADVVIEAIHSSDTPDPGEYDQDHDEWVIVIDGRARVELDGRIVAVDPGDWILIGAGVRHRVVSTTTGTRWIAVHLPPASGVDDRDGEPPPTDDGHAGRGTDH